MISNSRLVKNHFNITHVTHLCKIASSYQKGVYFNLRGREKGDRGKHQVVGVKLKTK